ncbi:hypothetical protein [Streptomyces rubellomurinus]|uniref:hypothetical protein n=1 Tax=Streptomyces rubellomurinus (strain ATCC 31215) TaxID=359131 RepID=UPI000695D4DC|nr:hypothetical protein [Streptomyces rubellomurinus]
MSPSPPAVAPAPAPAAAPRWPLILLRAAATTVALLALLQVESAGSFLNGAFDALAAHEHTATALAVAVLVQLAAAVLVRWPGRGPLRPLGAAAGLAAAVVGQIGAGYGRALGVHVVLGTLLVSGVLFALVDAWRLPLPARAGHPAKDGADGEGEGDGGGRLPRPGGPLEVAQ